MSALLLTLLAATWPQAFHFGLLLAAALLGHWLAKAIIQSASRD